MKLLKKWLRKDSWFVLGFYFHPKFKKINWNFEIELIRILHLRLLINKNNLFSYILVYAIRWFTASCLGASYIFTSEWIYNDSWKPLKIVGCYSCMFSGRTVLKFLKFSRKISKLDFNFTTCQILEPVLGTFHQVSRIFLVFQNTFGPVLRAVLDRRIVSRQI